MANTNVMNDGTGALLDWVPTRATVFAPTTSWECKRQPMPESAEEFEAILRSRRPTVFHTPGGIPSTLGWKTERWSDPAYWAKKVPSDLEVEVEMGSVKESSGVSTFGLHTELKKVPMSKWLAHLKGTAPGKNMKPEVWYMNIGATADEGQLDRYLRKDIAWPHWLTALKKRPGLNITADTSNTWWGHRHPTSRGKDQPDGRSTLHFDTYDNLNTCIVGMKRFKLFSPAEAKHARLRNGAVFVHEDGAIMGRDAKGEFGAFATKQAADLERGGVCDVHEGEMIFIPTGFLHEVHSFASPVHGQHFAINYFFTVAFHPEKKRTEDPTVCKSKHDASASRLLDAIGAKVVDGDRSADAPHLAALGRYYAKHGIRFVDAVAVGPASDFMREITTENCEDVRATYLWYLLRSQENEHDNQAGLFIDALYQRLLEMNRDGVIRPPPVLGDGADSVALAMGITFAKRGKMDEATKWFKEAHRRYKLRDETYFALARVEMEGGNEAKGRAHLRECLRINGKNEQCRGMAGEVPGGKKIIAQVDREVLEAKARQFGVADTDTMARIDNEGKNDAYLGMNNNNEGTAQQGTPEETQDERPQITRGRDDERGDERDDGDVPERKQRNNLQQNTARTHVPTQKGTTGRRWWLVALGVLCILGGLLLLAWDQLPHSAPGAESGDAWMDGGNDTAAQVKKQKLKKR